jgi:hypothetical protein
MCLTLQFISLVPTHCAADTQSINQSVSQSVQSISQSDVYEGTAKVLFRFDIPKFPKELLLY